MGSAEPGADGGVLQEDCEHDMALPWRMPHGEGGGQKPQWSELDGSTFTVSPGANPQATLLMMGRCSMGIAADNWLTYMDRLLSLGDDRAAEKSSLKTKMLKLVDIYYDALDAPKSGKKVEVPDDLKAELFPHHMGKLKGISYHSSSILGQIYDKVEEAFHSDNAELGKEIWKLPCFNIEIPKHYFIKWKERYACYRQEMFDAMRSDDEFKNDVANEIILKYKQLLYDAPDMEESGKDTQVIYEEAIAIYHITYDYARDCACRYGDDDISVKKCGFAWKVAGSALCNICASKSAGPREKPFTISPSLLRDLLLN